MTAFGFRKIRTCGYCRLWTCPRPSGFHKIGRNEVEPRRVPSFFENPLLAVMGIPACQGGFGKSPGRSCYRPMGHLAYNAFSEPDVAERIRKFYGEVAIPADSFARAVAFAMS